MGCQKWIVLAVAVGVCCCAVVVSADDTKTKEDRKKDDHREDKTHDVSTKKRKSGDCPNGETYVDETGNQTKHIDHCVSTADLNVLTLAATTQVYGCNASVTPLRSPINWTGSISADNETCDVSNLDPVGTFKNGTIVFFVCAHAAATASAHDPYHGFVLTVMSGSGATSVGRVSAKDALLGDGLKLHAFDGDGAKVETKIVFTLATYSVGGVDETLIKEHTQPAKPDLPAVSAPSA